MVQSSCSLKNGKLNETIEVSALWSISVYKEFKVRMNSHQNCQTAIS